MTDFFDVNDIPAEATGARLHDEQLDEKELQVQNSLHQQTQTVPVSSAAGGEDLMFKMKMMFQMEMMLSRDTML